MQVVMGTGLQAGKEKKGNTKVKNVRNIRIHHCTAPGELPGRGARAYRAWMRLSDPELVFNVKRTDQTGG
jgi:hypothetical protein